MHYKMSDVATEIKERENNPSTSKYERFVGLEHFVSGDIVIKKYGKTEDLESSMKVFHSGDILVARRNVYLRRASAVFFDGITSGDSIVLRAKSERIGRLLPFILNTDDFWDFADQYADGTMSTRLAPATLMEYEFDLPPEPEQEKLADKLWAKEKKKTAYQELLLKTDELVKSQFSEMFGDVSDSKETVSFETAFTIRDDLRKPINDSVRSGMHENATIPYYGANGQVDTINQYLMDCSAICLAEDCGAYGAGEASSYIVTGKSWVNNHAHVLIPNECCDINYANAYFKLLDLTSFVSGSTRLKLTQGKMKEIPIVLPSLEKQKQFASFVTQSDKSK